MSAQQHLIKWIQKADSILTNFESNHHNNDAGDAQILLQAMGVQINESDNSTSKHKQKQQKNQKTTKNNTKTKKKVNTTKQTKHKTRIRNYVSRNRNIKTREEFRDSG